MIKKPLLIWSLLALVLLFAVFYLLLPQGPKPQASPATKLGTEVVIVESPNAGQPKMVPTLPKDFPQAFLVDKKGEVVADETVGPRTTAIFKSKNDTKSLADNFAASIKDKDWHIAAQTNDSSSSQVLANIQDARGHYSTVEFRATLLPDYTEVTISYIR